MSSNTLGTLFTVTSFGESHGRCVGVVVDGCPAGLPLAEAEIQAEVDKRRPLPEGGGTPRAEGDQVEIFSGIFDGLTTGAPIGLIICNKDVVSGAYEKIRFLPRPGHADYTAFMKYGGFNDYRGGGRFSGRITVGFVMAGAVARKLLQRLGVEVLAHTVQVGEIKAKSSTVAEIRENVFRNPVRCADLAAAIRMLGLINQVASEGDSIGGIVEGAALNVPVGLGEPVFDTVEGELAKALLAIPAVKGVEFGAGFAAAGKRGSENNDAFVLQEGRIVTATNNAGGALGGISSGMPVVLRVAVKPTPSILKTQDTVNLKTMQPDKLTIRGRHDVCVVPRAVPVVESMMAITLCDFALRAGMIPRVLK